MKKREVRKFRGFVLEAPRALNVEAPFPGDLAARLPSLLNILKFCLFV